MQAHHLPATTTYKRQKVDVFEIKYGWTRISRYYDGGVEGVAGNVARFVAV